MSTDVNCPGPTSSGWPDGSDFSSNTTNANPISNGRTYIKDLLQGIPNCILVGLVIAKQEVHSFPDRKNPGTERCHFCFTLRDTSTDFINVNCWGSQPFINGLAKSFKLYDIVEVRNPQVQSKQNSEAEERWKPWTPSMYQLNLSETHSSVSLYSGWDLSEFDIIAHIPIKASNDFYTLGDVIANGQSLHGEHISLQAVVKTMKTPKDIVTKTGRHVRRCEIELFDDTYPSFPFVIWDEELANLSQAWTPKDNILFIADAKVTYDDYRKGMLATCDQKTIITTNPDTQEARSLYRYAQSVDLTEDCTTMGHAFDFDSVKDVYSIQQLKRLLSENGNDQVAEYGLTFAVLTSFDVDAAEKYFVVTRCTACKARIPDRATEICVNPDCPNASSGSSSIDTYFDIKVSLSDHTGTIENCRLTGKNAESVFNCTAVEFLDWSPYQCTEIKAKYLMERCKVVVRVPASSKSCTCGHVFSREPVRIAGKRLSGYRIGMTRRYNTLRERLKSGSRCNKVKNSMFVFPPKKRTQENRALRGNRKASSSSEREKRKGCKKTRLKRRGARVDSPSPEKRSRLALALVEINRRLMSQMMIWQMVSSAHLH